MRNSAGLWRKPCNLQGNGEYLKAARSLWTETKRRETPSWSKPAPGLTWGREATDSCPGHCGWKGLPRHNAWVVSCHRRQTMAGGSDLFTEERAISPNISPGGPVFVLVMALLQETGGVQVVTWIPDSSPRICNLRCTLAEPGGSREYTGPTKQMWVF